MTMTVAQTVQLAWANHLGQKVTETGPQGVKTVLIPPGEFEQFPRYHVTVTKPFRMGATEVTRGQFTAFVAATGYKTTGELGNPFRPFGAVIGPKNDSGSWRKPGYTADDDHPITHVSHADALAYCEWLSKVEGKGYRLPTEAEWRWACRAGATTRYPFGNDPKPLREYAHYKATSDGHPTQVGVRRPNTWGLFDMLGNVKEWAQDGMAPTREGAFADPLVGPRDDGMRVVCGGGYDGRTDVPNAPGWHSATCDCNTRGGHHWYVAQPGIGFRVVREP
jgi:formylglycine-generating enzyme required for sulfatase activity